MKITTFTDPWEHMNIQSEHRPVVNTSTCMNNTHLIQSCYLNYIYVQNALLLEGETVKYKEGPGPQDLALCWETQIFKRK